MSLEQKLKAKILDFTGQSRDIGGNPTRVLEMLERLGAVMTCKKLLLTTNIGGFERISKEKLRPDLSIEAIVLHPEFDKIFDKNDRIRAVFNLQQLPGGAGEGWRQWVKS